MASTFLFFSLERAMRSEATWRMTAEPEDCLVSGYSFLPMADTIDFGEKLDLICDEACRCPRQTSKLAFPALPIQTSNFEYS